MEDYLIDEDIKVMYVTASSFPEGVEAAHQTLHSLLSGDDKRGYFGISRPEANHGIIYKAAAEELKPGEAETLGLETFVIKKGIYASELITDFMSDIPSIGRTFQKLLAQPGLDPNGYCLEIYIKNKDVRCLVGLKNKLWLVLIHI
jgi:hypothetical protein